jgi:hypothetical protein
MKPNITIEIVRLSSAVAELRLQANVKGELRGRLMGPRSPHGTTVEVAYPVKATHRSTDHCSGVVIIPEPNFWESDNPLTYGGPIEIWQDGKMIHEQWVDVGLKQKD